MVAVFTALGSSVTSGVGVSKTMEDHWTSLLVKDLMATKGLDKLDFHNNGYPGITTSPQRGEHQTNSIFIKRRQAHIFHRKRLKRGEPAMFDRISNLFVAKRIQKVLKKNKIEILQIDPGYLDLKSPLWLRDGVKWRQVAKDLQADKRIMAVTYNEEEGAVLIIFDPSLMEDYAQMEQMLKKFQQIA